MPDPRPLYVSRPVLNAPEILRWAKGQGFETTLPAEDLHVTIAFSRTPLDWFAVPDDWGDFGVPVGGPRAVEPLGDKGAVVLLFRSDVLNYRWQQFREAGASWDWAEYQPHVTLTYKLPEGMDLRKVEPYRGEIQFGPERFEELSDDWAENLQGKSDIIPGMDGGDFRSGGRIEKLDEEKRIAYGWFSVIEQDGEAVVDSHGDIIREPTLVKAVHDFILEARAGKVMHQGRRVADVIESIVFTKDVQKALGIDLGRVGWFGAMKFRDEEVWSRVKSGELPAFSIGGVGKRRVI